MLLKKTFRNRLIIIFILTIIIPLIFFGGITYIDIYQYLTNVQNREVLNHIKNDTNLVNTWFHDKKILLQSIATSLGSGILNINNSEEIEMYLNKQKNNKDGILSLFIIKDNGTSYNSNFWSLEDVDIDFRERFWYIGAKESNDIYVSSPYEDIVTGKKVMTISIPIKDKNDNFLGVVGIDFEFSKIIEKIEKINIMNKSSYIVLNSNGDIVHNQASENSIDIDHKEFMKEKLKLIQNDYNNKDYIGVYTSLDSMDLDLIVFEDLSIYKEYVNKYLVIFISTFVTTIVIVFFSVMYMSKKIAWPVFELKKGVRNLLKGDLDTRIKEAEDDDFRELMMSFNLMAQSIKDSYMDLARKSKELFDKNEELQEMNIELEAAFNELQLLTDKLNHSEKKYKSLVENISDLLWVSDEEGNIIYINDYVHDILGYEPESLIGQNISTIMCPLHKYEDCEEIVEQFKHRDFNGYDLWFLKSNKIDRIVISANITRIYNNGEMTIQGIGRDVTEKRILEQELLRKNSRLEALNEASYFLTSKAKMDRLFEVIVEKIHGLMKLEICSIRILKGNKLVLKASSGALKECIHKNPINVNQDIIGNAIRKKELIVYNDVSETGEYNWTSELYKNIDEIKTLIFIPLIHDEKVYGVLTVGSMEYIAKSEIEILRSFSNHAVAAIEKTNLYENLKVFYFKTIKALATAVEAKDSYTEGHSIRVANYSSLIAEYMGLSETKIEEINIAGILHDIGKIGIEDGILTKPGKLTPEEYEIIKKHPTIGYKILSPIGLSENILKGVLFHHRRYDLKGYPSDISLDTLPLEARIIGVADAFDAMTTNRAYSKPKTIEEAMEELIRFKGTEFCPEVVNVMKNLCNNNRGKLENIINSSEPVIIDSYWHLS